MSKTSIVMLTLTLALGLRATTLAEAPANGLTEAERRGGWRMLFDGESADAWRNYRDESLSDGWQVRDGALVRARDGAGDIVTKEEFDSFELSLEYRISKGGNSGLMFHVQETQPAPWQTGPEVQIQDNVDGHDPQKSGWLYQLYQPVKPEWAIRFENQVGFTTPDIADATRPAGEWNQIYLRVSPLQSEVVVNGVSYYYFQKGSDDWKQRVAASKFAKYEQFGKAERGHICLQDHGDEVAFRNIKVRPLAADGSAPNPVDGKLALKETLAFPNLTWEGWQGVDDSGRIQTQRPLVLTHAGDQSGRIFVASQSGMIHVFPKQPNVRQAKMFLDLREATHDWQKDDEEGLLGLAFHPNYKQNGWFYVYYHPEREPRVAYVSRFQVSSDDPNRADPDSEQIVMRIPQPFSNHNGGSIVFGHDGYLYVGLGDGGGRNDPKELAQDTRNWMGCVLRIDVNGSEGERPYRIPADNPFRGVKQVPPEIYAYGFRNIWRLAVDRETGLLWCGDVGQDLWEEVNVIRAGGNYGWSSREGSYPFGNGKLQGAEPFVDPVWEYDHRVGKSITGGFVYRGSRLPELQGKYLYADYVSGNIWALQWNPKTGKVEQNLAIREGGVPVFSFGEDEDGEVYYLIAAPTGKTIFRFERSGEVSPGR